MPENKYLQYFDTAKRALAQARNIDEVKDIRNRAEALREYARQQRDSLEMQNYCAEIKLRAERKAGEMLSEQTKWGGDRKSESRLQEETLNDLGINKIQSHRWQAIATIPEDDFEQYINNKKANAQEVTSNGAYALARQIKRAAESKEPPPLPTGQYRTIVIDPPWPMEKILRDKDNNPTQHDMDYPTLGVDEIKNLEIPDIASEDGCHLYLWTTQRYLPVAFDILRSWGFKYIFTMVWHKPGGFQPFNLPQYNCEFVLFGRKGDLEFTTTKDFNCCFYAQRREHSRKPDEFYDLVRRVSPEPRIDVFSREKRPGFEQYGDETTKFTE